MTKLRFNCECCDCDLPPDSHEAMVCAFECTWCAGCAAACLEEVCPNCGVGLALRPAHPAELLDACPASRVRVVQAGLHRG